MPDHTATTKTNNNNNPNKSISNNPTQQDPKQDKTAQGKRIMN